MTGDGMRGLFLAAGLVLAALLAGPRAEAAALGDVFSVHAVKVDVTAASAREARIKAIDEGRARAFAQLLRKLTVAADWPRLPALSPDDLLDAERGFEVVSEKASSVRYLAEITYAFDPDFVRGLLNDAGFGFAQNQAQPLLVVPVLVTPERSYLWEGDNPLLALVEDARFKAELIPFLVPLGDGEDILAVSTETAATAEFSALEGLAGRYGVKEVLIAIARLGREGEELSLELTLRRLSASGSELAEISLRSPVAAPVPGQEPELLPRELALRALDEAMAPWREAWKAATRVSLADQQRLLASALFPGGLADWMAIRRALEDTATVTAFEAGALSARGAEVDLTFAGSIDQLTLALAQSGVQLAPEGGRFVLRVDAAPAPSLTGALPGAAGTDRPAAVPAPRDGAQLPSPPAGR